MPTMPAAVSAFLAGHRFAVAGVSRHPGQPANAIFKRLRDSGFDVFPVNPQAATVEGVPCYANLAAVPGPLDGVVIATHPAVALDIVRQCAANGVRKVWFHRSFGDGSVSAEAVKECERLGIESIVGGCPLMYCGHVDPAHKCFRWFLELTGRLPC